MRLTVERRDADGGGGSGGAERLQRLELSVLLQAVEAARSELERKLALGDDDFGDFTGERSAEPRAAATQLAEAQALLDAQAAVLAGQQWPETQREQVQLAGATLQRRQAEVAEMHAEAEATFARASGREAELEEQEWHV